MKAYVCTIGEQTTDLCVDTLADMGFDVVVVSGKETWHEKYLRFINSVNEDCIRIDADTIPSTNVRAFFVDCWERQVYMGQCYGWDFYKNNVGIVSPVFYSKEGLEFLRKNKKKIREDRPETSAWRLLPDEKVYTSELLCGIHGIYQTKKDIERHIQHKKDRKQIEEYNFSIAKKCETFGNH